MSKTTHYWLVQQAIYENIKFADVKATSLVALNLAVITGLYVLEVFQKSNLWLFGLACAAFCFLAFSVIFSVVVLFPRGNTTFVNKTSSLCNFHKIGYMSYEEFKAMIKGAKKKELQQDLKDFLYDRSQINKQKYKWLKVEITLGAIGWLLSFIVAGITILG